MNKIKKTIAELRAHLGTDERGLTLLGEVSRQAVDLRKALRASSEQVQEGQRKVNAFRERLADEQNQATELQAQVERGDAIRRQQKKDIARLTKEVEELRNRVETLLDELAPAVEPPTPDEKCPPRLGGEPATCNTKLHDMRAYTAMFNTLRREMRRCPRMVAKCEVRARNVKTKGVPKYNLEELINDYSPSSMLTLGRFVATLTMLLDQPLIIQSVMPLGRAREKGMMYYSDDSLRRFCRWWLKKNVEKPLPGEGGITDGSSVMPTPGGVR